MELRSRVQTFEIPMPKGRTEIGGDMVEIIRLTIWGPLEQNLRGGVREGGKFMEGVKRES